MSWETILRWIGDEAGSVLHLPPDLLQKLHRQLIPEWIKRGVAVLFQDSIYALLPCGITHEGSEQALSGGREFCWFRHLPPIGRLIRVLLSGSQVPASSDVSTRALVIIRQQIWRAAGLEK